MEILFSVGKFMLVVLAVAGVALPLIIERRNYQFVWSVWRRFRVKMFFECLVLFVLTLAIAILLWQVPGLNWGWLNLFSSTGGNMLIQPVQEGSKSSNELIRLLVPLFFIALAIVLPFLAKAEEEDFRKGVTEWGEITKKSIKFGLIHCLVGIPLAAGIAIILPGLFYGLKYKRAFDANVKVMGCRQAQDEAVMISTTYHTMYNTIVVMPLLYIAILAV